MSIDDTPIPPEPARRRRRVGRPRSGRPAPRPPQDQPADAEAEWTPAPEPAPAEELPPPAEDEADSSAFYRYSGLLGLAAAALLAGAVVLYTTQGAMTRNVAVLLIVAAVLAVLFAIPRWGEMVDWLRTR